MIGAEGVTQWSKTFRVMGGEADLAALEECGGGLQRWGSTARDILRRGASEMAWTRV